MRCRRLAVDLFLQRSTSSRQKPHTVKILPKIFAHHPVQKGIDDGIEQGQLQGPYKMVRSEEEIRVLVGPAAVHVNQIQHNRYGQPHHQHHQHVYE